MSVQYKSVYCSILSRSCKSIKKSSSRPLLHLAKRRGHEFHFGKVFEYEKNREMNFGPTSESADLFLQTVKIPGVQNQDMQNDKKNRLKNIK